MKFNARHLSAVLCIFLLTGAARLSDVIPQNPVLSRYLVPTEDVQSMPQIAEQFEVKDRTADGFEVIIPVPERENFLRLSPHARLLEADLEAKFRGMTDENRAGFHTFASVKTHLEKIVSDYPEIASLSNYGKSMEGRELFSLRLFTKTGPTKKPQLVITSATHGDELITVEVVFGILDALVSQYGRDARITKIVDEHELYFLPVINPDGYIRQQRYANGVDPNREYPWPEKPDRNPNPAIKAVMSFFQSHDIKASIDYHSTGGMIMYPWAYTYDSVPADDKSAFHELTKKMAAHNGYQYGSISKVIYVAKGSSADYYYWKFGTKALGIEIKSDGSSSLIPSMVKENLESTLRFIESF
jgi:hypothetical protein